MSRKTVWVSPDGQSRWDVKSEGARRAAANYENKGKAVDRAKEIAKSVSLGQVIIQGRDGKIQTEYTYGEDPRRFSG